MMKKRRTLEQAASQWIGQNLQSKALFVDLSDGIRPPGPTVAMVIREAFVAGAEWQLRESRRVEW